MRERLEDPWRVRVLGPDGPDGPVGAGVLLTGHRVLTCAHVVESALGDDAGQVTEGASVTVDFPGSLAGGTRTAGVVPGGWARGPVNAPTSPYWSWTPRRPRTPHRPRSAAAGKPPTARCGSTARPPPGRAPGPGPCWSDRVA